MTRYRNLLFVVVLAAMALTTAKARAASYGLDGCYPGAAESVGVDFYKIPIDCYEVYDCEVTYPDFCTDPLGDLWTLCFDEICNTINGWVFDHISPSPECENSGGCFGYCYCYHSNIPD